ncbi:hypothetical protein PVK06_040450 [Gossypium arboreum]|uniref:Uncharacterized protein n=1 Tax=Gossypium arboreum TaxID=29729 RepID=A0ABR0N5I0_GOSAR|nr:hypothetical protein PVK06_040450 [Gossypium arboreum]
MTSQLPKVRGDWAILKGFLTSIVRASVTDLGFLPAQPMTLEAGFHLPLHFFFYHLLDEYGHAQVIGGPFDAQRVNFYALSHLTGAHRNFDIHPSRATWKEFVEEWKNSSRLYFAYITTETSAAPITRCEGNDNIEVEEEEEEEKDLADLDDSNANS